MLAMKASSVPPERLAAWLHRTAWLEARGAKMACDSPMQLVESIASANLTGQKVDVEEPGDYSPGPNWLEAALANASRQDGARTMKLWQGIIRNLPDEYLPNLLESIIQGWVKSDPAAAIRWTAQHNIPKLGNALHSALMGADRGGEALLAALPTASEDEGFHLLTALSSCYEEELRGQDPEQILREVTPQQADQLLRRTLYISMSEKAWDEAQRVMSRASREEQLGYMLPNLATRWLSSDPAGAAEWIRSLPEDDRQAVFEKAGSHYEFNEAGRAAFQHPLGSIFAAWTRRDPTAAISAAAELPSRNRKIAQAEIALTLSYQDGRAGLRFILNNGISENCRMDAVLRAAFSQSRAASRAAAALLKEHPELKANSRYFLIHTQVRRKNVTGNANIFERSLKKIGVQACE